MDFLKYIENDLVLNILKRLDDPADLVRASTLSRNWQDFVIGSELSKHLCLRQFPQVANIVDVHDVTIRKRKLTDVGSSENGELLSRNHKVYTSLLHALQKLKSSSPNDCIKEKFSASYYQSKGQKDDDNIPEKLIFKLKYDQCVITEIDMMPYREYLQGIEEDDCSAKSVRFRMGFPKSATKEFQDSVDPADDDQFIWTYTSPEFPMGQVCKTLPQGGRGQRFELPEPVLCIGGFVMVELLGRVQMDANKGPYYINIFDVNVLGRSLSPAFKAEVQDPSGKFVLKYNGGRLRQTIQFSFNGGRRPAIKQNHDSGNQNRTKHPMRKSTCACACQLV